VLYHFKAYDCPDANGRQPQHGEQKWTLSFILEGEDYLEVEIGRKGRKAIRDMLLREEADDLAEAN
jgi:hypothetical protein